MYVLEEVFKSKKNENSDHFNLRIQRSLSWLKKAAYLSEDLDLQYVSLWISLNSICIQATSYENSLSQLDEFIHKIYQHDQAHKISQLIWGKMDLHIEQILQSPYLMQSYWDFKNQAISETAWKSSFEHEKKHIQNILDTKDSRMMLIILFKRMQTLRAQILQGGSSYNGAVNRQQLKSCCHVLLFILPIFLEILIENPKIFDYQKPYYPNVQVS